MSKKNIEMALQKSLLQYLGKGYLALVLVIKTTQINETTDLSDTIIYIIYLIKINKKNEKNLTENSNRLFQLLKLFKHKEKHIPLKNALIKRS